MNRQEIVRKVAQKLQIDEALVDSVYMHQTQAVSDSLKHPDRNLIFLPGIGSLNFRVSKGADKLHTYLKKIERYKAKMEVVDNPRTITSLTNRVNQMAELSTVLKWKVSLTSDKYEGIRTGDYNKSLAYYSEGKFVDLVADLRKQRKDGFTTEIIPEPKEAMGQQTGDSKSLPTLSILHEKEGQSNDGSKNEKMQRKFLRTVRSEGDF